MKLYGANVCPFVHRARLTLAEKGVDYEYVAIDLRNKPAWYHEVLPSGKVPLLEDGSNRVWESAIVCEYLEERFPEPALLPTDPGPRARARIWIDWVSNTLVAAYYKLLKAQSEEEQAEHRKSLREALAKLEKEGFQESSWLHGTELSLVDLLTYPWFERWRVLEHYRNFPVPNEFSKLQAWIATIEERESVKAIAEPPSFYIDQYAHYARPAEAVTG